VSYAERVVRVDDRRVERAEAERPLSIFDCLFATAGMAKDDGPEAKCFYRGAVYLERLLDGVYRGLSVSQAGSS